jgi:hypothetical protein
VALSDAACVSGHRSVASGGGACGERACGAEGRDPAPALRGRCACQVCGRCCFPQLPLLTGLRADGLRTRSRTRVAAGYLNLTLTTGKASAAAIDAVFAGSLCNLTGAWRVGGRNHWAQVVQNSQGQFTAAAHGAVPRGGWTTATGLVLANGTVTVAFNHGRGSDHATISTLCHGVTQLHWADTRRHPTWNREPRPVPSPSPPGPPAPPIPHSVGSMGYVSNDTETASWRNVEDVEFVYSGVASNWAETRCTLATASLLPGDKPSTLVKLKQPCFWNLVNAPCECDR